MDILWIIFGIPTGFLLVVLLVKKFGSADTHWIKTGKVTCEWTPLKNGYKRRQTYDECVDLLNEGSFKWVAHEEYDIVDSNNQFISKVDLRDYGW